MKMKIYITLLLLLTVFPCLEKSNERNPLIGKTFRLVNSEIFEDIEIEYYDWELLDNNKFIYDSKWDSMVVLQQGNWDYFVSNGKEFIILEELEQLRDTFELIHNDNYEQIRYVNLKGNSLEFKQIAEKATVDTNLLFDKTWFCKSDSFSIGFDTLCEPIKMNFANPEFKFFKNHEYNFKFRKVYSGKWKFNKSGNRIYLDSLNNNRDIIRIEKLTNDSLIFWQRNNRQVPTLYKCVSCNNV